MDHSGRYIFARLCLGKNDCEVFTGSPLYLQEGEFFSEDEFVVRSRVTVIYVAVTKALNMMT